MPDQSLLAPAQLARIEALTAARKVLVVGPLIGPPAPIDRLDLEMLAEWILNGPQQ